jgi:hypothetical protein
MLVAVLVTVLLVAFAGSALADGPYGHKKGHGKVYASGYGGYNTGYGGHNMGYGGYGGYGGHQVKKQHYPNYSYCCYVYNPCVYTNYGYNQHGYGGYAMSGGYGMSGGYASYGGYGGY